MKAGTTISAVSSLTFNVSATSAGNLLYVALSFTGNPPTITPPSGWSLLNSNSSGANGYGISVYYIANASSITSALFSFSSSVQVEGVFAEISNANAVDQSNTSAGTVSNSEISATIVPTQAPSIAMAAFSNNGDGGNTPTNSYTLLQSKVNNSTSCAIDTAYLVLTSSGSGTSTSLTLVNGPNNYGGSISNFYQVAVVNLTTMFLPQPEVPANSWRQMRDASVNARAQTYFDPTQAWFLSDPFKALANPVEWDHQPIEYPYASFHMMARPTHPDPFYADPTPQAILPALPLTPGWTQLPPEKPISRAFAPARPDATTVWPIYPDWSSPVQAESFWHGNYERAPRQSNVRSGPEIHVTLPYPNDAVQNLPPKYDQAVRTRQQRPVLYSDMVLIPNIQPVVLEINHAYDVQPMPPSRGAWFRPVIAGGMERTATVLVEVLEDVLQVWNLQQTQPTRPSRLQPQPAYQHELSVTAPAQVPPMIPYFVVPQVPTRPARPDNIGETVTRLVPYEETVSTVQGWHVPAASPLPRQAHRPFMQQDTTPTLDFAVDLAPFRWDSPSAVPPRRTPSLPGFMQAGPMLNPTDLDQALFEVWQGQTQVPVSRRGPMQPPAPAELSVTAPAQIPPMIPYFVSPAVSPRQAPLRLYADSATKVTPFLEDPAVLEIVGTTTTPLPIRPAVRQPQGESAFVSTFQLDPALSRGWDVPQGLPRSMPARREGQNVYPIIAPDNVPSLRSWDVAPQLPVRQAASARPAVYESPALWAWTQLTVDQLQAWHTQQQSLPLRQGRRLDFPESRSPIQETDAASFEAWQGQQQVPAGLWVPVSMRPALSAEGQSAPSWHAANVVIVSGPYWAVAAQIFVAGAVQAEIEPL